MRQERARRRGARRAASAALVVMAAAVLAGCALRPPRGNSHVPPPARPVDLTLYAGTWYELARYENRFERGCSAVSAQYGLLPDGRLSLRNLCHAGGPAGPLKSIAGKTRVVPDSGNAKLKVSFFGPFYFGNYWVLDHATDYSWSIVGEPSGRYLWLLVRDPHPGAAAVAMLYQRAAQLGYDTTLLRPTEQP